MKNKLCILAVVLAAVLAVGYALRDFFAPSGQESLDALRPTERLAVKRNIVVLGVDPRPEDNDPGRSDTLFVVMFDSDKKDVALLSVPRDTRVKIQKHGWDKINHAYAYGGRKLTQATVEELLGLHIHNYVAVDFKGFAGLVDAIGGIDIDVEKDMQYHDPYDGFTVDLKAGRQHLNGAAAIQYVRYRDEDGDIGRIRRQQHFLMAVYEKINSAQLLLRLPGLSKQLFTMIETDLSMGDMLEIGRALRAMVKEKGLVMATVPGTPEYIEGISYWLPDIVELRRMVADMQGAQMSDKYVTAAKLLAAEYEREAKRSENKEVKGSPTTEKELRQPGPETMEELSRRERQLLQQEKKLEEDIKQAKDKKIRQQLRKEKKAIESKREEVSAAIKKMKKAEAKALKETAEKEKAAPKSETTAGDKSNKTAIAKEEVLAAPAQKTSASRSQTTLRLINRSGDPAAASHAAAQLAKAGYFVIDGGSDTPLPDTRVVAFSSSVVYKLSKIPFKNKIFIAAKPEGNWDGTVILGQDYRY